MRSRARRGITLFEAVAAMTIVAMTAVSALAAVGAEFRTAERARRALEAEALATARMDMMQLLSDRELQALPDSVEAGVFSPPLDEYAWQTSATPDQEFAGLYTVRVTIAWPGGEYEQRTNLYRRPPQLTRRQQR